jgi:tRNA-splicing ligase RtcB
LGGGNHFLEVEQDQTGRVWVMLHSGSRYLGVTIRDYYVERGHDLAGIDRRVYPKLPHLPAESDLARDYLADSQFALDFARESRKEMLIRVLECFSELVPACSDAAWPGLIDAAEDMPHNFVAREEHFGENLCVQEHPARHAGAERSR